MYQKFMGKKFFHPTSWQNLEKVWEVEEKEKQRIKRDKDLSQKYKEEQERLNTLALISKDEKLKLGLSFMYDQPPGLRSDTNDKPVVAPTASKIDDKKSKDSKKFLNDGYGSQLTEEDKISRSLESPYVQDRQFLVDSLKNDNGLVLRNSVLHREVDHMSFYDNHPVNENTCLIFDEEDRIDDPIEDLDYQNGDPIMYPCPNNETTGSEDNYFQNMSLDEKKRLLAYLELSETPLNVSNTNKISSPTHQHQITHDSPNRKSTKSSDNELRHEKQSKRHKTSSKRDHKTASKPSSRSHKHSKRSHHKSRHTYD